MDIRIIFLVFVYALISNYVLKMPDYWWKTSMCFAAGCVLAKHKDVINTKIFAKSSYCVLLFLFGLVAWCYTIVDFHYIFIPQLMAYVLIASSVIIIWDKLGSNISVLEEIGKVSLAVYLVHIGIVDSVYVLEYSTNIKTFIFAITTAIGTIVVALIIKNIWDMFNKEIRIKEGE